MRPLMMGASGRLCAIWACFVALAWLSSCSAISDSSGQSGGGRVPPAPPLEASNLGPDEPPLAWVGGTLSRATSSSLDIAQALGPSVTLKRLGGEATIFFRASGGRWVTLDPLSSPLTGQVVCAQALLGARDLVALRVFLGADCGPAGP